jgi:hypothetical protein
MERPESGHYGYCRVLLCPLHLLRRESSSPRTPFLCQLVEAKVEDEGGTYLVRSSEHEFGVKNSKECNYPHPSPLPSGRRE